MTLASASSSPMDSCGAIMSFAVSIASPDLIFSSPRTHPLNHHSISINYHRPHHWTSRFIVARNKTWHTNRVLKKFISQSQMSWATKTVFYRISCCVGVIYYFFSAFRSFVSQERIISLTLFGFVEIVTLKLHIFLLRLQHIALATCGWAIRIEETIRGCLWPFPCAQKNNKFLIISRHCLSLVVPFFLSFY